MHSEDNSHIAMGAKEKKMESDIVGAVILHCRANPRSEGLAALAASLKRLAPDEFQQAQESADNADVDLYGVKVGSEQALDVALDLMRQTSRRAPDPKA